MSATLADGRAWLLAGPVYRAGRTPMTAPDVDTTLDRFYERTVLGEDIPLDEVFDAARTLLLANYDLADDEVNDLLDVDGAEEARELARVVAEALFGPEERTRSYSDWVRASFLANGLAGAEVPASAVPDLLAVLLATSRTVPPAQFIDACRAARDREARETLI